MRLIRLVVAAAVLVSWSSSTTSGQPAAVRAVPAASSARFELTVDSIMCGPDLVGYPPSGLRWSADSQQLYLQWRKPGEKAASTFVVSRHGGDPGKLSDDEVRNVPPAAGGRRDAARTGVLFVDDGDVVMVDAANGTPRQITRTTGNESNPRWARKDTAITYVRDGNLFAVSLDAASPAVVAQLADVGPKKPEPRLTDSQKFIRVEEETLIRQGSPIDFAEGLKSALLICHENHAFTGATSWGDEYRRTFQLFEDNLRLAKAGKATD